MLGRKSVINSLHMKNQRPLRKWLQIIRGSDKLGRISNVTGFMSQRKSIQKNNNMKLN